MAGEINFHPSDIVFMVRNLTITTAATGTIYREQSIHAHTSHDPDGSSVIVLMAFAGF